MPAAERGRRKRNFSAGSVGWGALALDVPVDEIVHAQPRRPRAAVVVVTLEIHHVLALDDLAAFLEQEAVYLQIVRRPGIEHDAVAVLGIVVGESGAALDPGLGLVLAGHGPTHESNDLVVGVDHEPEMPA